jgi:hypothetical protein
VSFLWNTRYQPKLERKQAYKKKIISGTAGKGIGKNPNLFKNTMPPRKNLGGLSRMQEEEKQPGPSRIQQET